MAKKWTGKKKARKAISLSTRMAIFERDDFTCQFCGGKPPGCVLECDHVTPLAKGGSNDPSNLITACQECNRGKSASILDIPRHVKAQTQKPIDAKKGLNALFKKTPSPKELFAIRDEIIPKYVQDSFFWFSDSCEWVFSAGGIEELANEHGLNNCPEDLKVAYFYLWRIGVPYGIPAIDQILLSLSQAKRDLVLLNLAKGLSLAEDPIPW